MTAAKPNASFPIKKISFQPSRSAVEKSFVKSHASNSESLRMLEEQKEEAKLAARETARRLAARGYTGDLLGETALNKKGIKAKRSRWTRKPKKVFRHVNSTQLSLHEEEISLGWTQTSATEGLTAVMEDGASKSSRSKTTTSSPRKLIKKFNSNHPNEFKMPQTQDVSQLAINLSESGAYACSVCGTIYGSLANATRHEDKCFMLWFETMEKNRDEATARKLLSCPAQHMPQQAPTANQVPTRGLQRSNEASSHSNAGDGAASSALSSRPKYQKVPSSSLGFVPPKTGGEVPLASSDLLKQMVFTDEALVDIVKRSKYIMRTRCLKELAAMDSLPDEEVDQAKKAALLLKKLEFEAQEEIALLSRDRHYYGMVEQKSLERIYGPLPKYDNPYKHYYRRHYAAMGVDIGSTNKKDANADKGLLPKKTWNTIKHRFEHAYDLIKEGPASDVDGMDHAKKSSDKSSKNMGDIVHGKNTLYVNVVVKNSVQVVNNELQRMARGWWQSENAGENASTEKALDFQFEWIRNQTQKRVIQLAAVALASDFTPRKVAIQLSNDLYRLMGPQLMLRGVKIQTEIEYRSGQYFVLAVNVLHIDWILLFDPTGKQLARERRRWQKEQRLREQRRPSVIAASAASKEATKKRKRSFKELLIAARMRFPSRNEVVAQFLAFMDRFHFIISLPLVNLLYYTFCKYMVDKYILTVVTDDIFRYVEKKGMEMQLEIKGNNKQASFMLAALRELREDDKKRKEKEDESDEGEGAKPIVGPLLGPLVKDDAGDVKLPIDFNPPAPLEFEALEVDLPIGFLRLRWALLHTDSTFWKDAFFVDIMNYANITDGKWSTNEKEIGLPKTPDGVDESAFVNATLEFSYLMPKSAFVKANTCYATHEITHYDDHCFVIKEKTLTPEVPYGNTFVAWTQYSIVNTGNNTCRMVCSVEAEFPNGPPMVARQIKSGMRSGTSEKFVLLGETICRYADAVP